ARRRRNRRSRASDPQRHCGIAAWRRTAGGRQRTRKRPDCRRSDTGLQRPRGGCGRAQGEGRVSEPLWTLDAMADAMMAQRAGNLPHTVPGLSIDTRTIRPGEAFFAIQGENRDGHDFVAAALKAGAGVAVVARDKAAAQPEGVPLLMVADVLAALNDLARAS